MFLIDDILLRTVGISLPPFDTLWLLETITDYADNARHEEIQRRTNDKIKENRLLYELGEITKGEYENRNMKLSQRQKISNLKDRKDLKKKIISE